jgi:DNA adenine methylase
MGYPGGKGKCFQRLINLMPPHRVYIETHVGSGAVLRNKRAAARSIAIDLDARVVAQWNAEARTDLDIVHGDAHSFIARYNFAGDELLYCDPPYVSSARRREKIYRHDYSDEDHRELLRTLRRVPAMVMISGYANELYDSALADWRRVSFTAMSHSGIREECVWMNYPPARELHDTRWLGHTYRHRQSIGRKHTRWLKKFELLESTERYALMRALNARFRTDQTTVEQEGALCSTAF